MANNNSIQYESQKKGSLYEDSDELKKIFRLLVSRWVIFLISMILALLLAFLYISFTLPTYRVSAAILIDDESNRSFMEDSQILEGFGLGGSMKNLDNQIMVLSSRTLIGRTLDLLPFETDFYRKRFRKKLSLYPDSPLRIIPANRDSLPRDIEFTFKYLYNDQFRLKAEFKDAFELNITSSFGEMISTPGGRFTIELSDSIAPSKKLDRDIKFKFHNRKKQVEEYISRLKVEKASRTGTIVNLRLEGTNKTMDTEFLAKLTEIFLETSVDKKNQEAIRTIHFIDDQLIGISDSLVITENKLQRFRSTNKVMNLSAQGQVIINQAMSLENQKASLEMENNYYKYLLDYLEKDSVGQAPVAPATMGITDPGLTRLVSDLADLQGQYYSKSLGEKNPLQNQMAQRVRNTKEALRETIIGVQRANNLSLNEINKQILVVNSQASALPVTERQLLGIERKYKLNDALYTFLLEKRAAAQIQKASNMPDNEIVDFSEADMVPVKPKIPMIYLVAIIAGLGIPFSWILLADVFNIKVKEDDDIKRLTDIPITGHIPHSVLKNNTVVLDDPGSEVAESFRSLRSRMQFFTKESRSPVILITSTIPDEGKTFTSINLATVYSLMGKKTVLVGFDLRKPKIYLDFGLKNDRGVTTWLIGKHGLNEIIQKTKYDNLYMITAGPIPPNPSELIALEKTEELIKLLREKFECIIIDSSPVGVVSDALRLSSLTDTTILIVRQNTSIKDLLENTIKDLKNNDVKSLSIVMNDLKHDKRYGYNGKYGYSYGKPENQNSKT